jgi:hypothetical protein
MLIAVLGGEPGSYNASGSTIVKQPPYEARYA